MNFNATTRLIGQAEVSFRTTYSRSQLYRLERAGQFPARLRIGVGRVAWLLSEVLAWIEVKNSSRKADRYVPAAGVAVVADG